MRNLQRRVRTLERLLQWRVSPNLIEQITRRALESLSSEDLELLGLLSRESDEGTQVREMTASEEAACGAWQNSVDGEARRVGFRSFADAERLSRCSGGRS